MKKRHTISILGLMLGLILAMPVFTSADISLKEREPQLCYTCHKELKKELHAKTVHNPFKEGQCSTCHNVHASSHKGLVRDNINDLCFSCHNDLKKRVMETRMHGAIRDGKCTDCHKAHSSEFTYLLVNAERDICFNCHKELKDDIRKLTVHPPFNRGECSSCHNAHASRQYNLLASEPNKICQRCHQPGCTVQGASITDKTSKMDCLTCHTGHSANTKGLLGPYGHPDFLDKRCEKCHKPFRRGAPVETVIKGKELCFSCHVKDPEKFHEDDTHATFQENYCLMCHDYHASNREKMTVNEQTVCLQCHSDVDSKITRMTKRLKGIRCTPVKNRECFECHAPMHSRKPWYFKEDSDVIKTCVKCHTKQHRVTHPLGEGVIDPRNGEIMTCITCHSMHNAQAKFMLQYEGDRELCIQCHKMY